MILWTTLALAAPLADAVAAGDCRTVLDDAPLDATWRVPRAWCELKLEMPDAALATLEPEIPGVLGEYGKLVAARAHLALKQDEQAEALLAGLKLPGSAGDEVRASLAELYARRGQVTKLDALKVEPPARGAFLRAVALRNADKQAESDAALVAVWRGAEVGGWDDQARELLGSDWKPSDEDRAARLKALRKRGRIDDAADLAHEMGLEDGPALEMARVNLQARRYEAALVHWERALGKPEVAKGAPEPLFDYALTWARTGNYDTAAVVYQRVMAQHPTTSEADFASYKLGYMAYDEGDCERAGPLFDAHLKRHPKSKHATEALWFAARCAWRNQDIAGATEHWQRLLDGHSRSSLAPGAVYWLARAKGLQGDAEAEKAGMERVLSSWPVSGYAWFAAERLGKRFETKPIAKRPKWPASLASRDDVRRAEALLEVGFRDWALDELRPVAGVAKDKTSALAAAWAFLAAGDYRKAQTLARPYCVSPWKQGNPVAQQACTPRPEAAIVQRVAQRYDLFPLVPYGIMTAESALKPKVTSVAGARGLMQLMPKEGPRIHAELYPERGYDADDLYSAPYNASMGTAELGMKRQSLAGTLKHDDLPALIASYNGGEEAVRRWLEAYDGPPEFDEFAEDVGYTETRRYVKRVLGFVMAYRWVYGDP